MQLGASVTLTLGLLLGTGLLLGLLASRFDVPRVAAYVVAGMIYSPTLLGRVLGIEIGEWAEGLTAFALGIIAYLIGGSITTGQLQRTGRVITVTVVGQSLGALIVVFLAVYWLAGDRGVGSPSWELALVLAAIATTTAPAATVAVLHQYNARGPLASTLLGVVALDDALGIIIFALALVVITGMSLLGGVGVAAWEISGALLVGVAGGWVLCRVARHVKQSSLRLPVVLTAVLITTGIAQVGDFSALLAAMVLGFFSRHFLKAAGDRLFAPVEYFEELVFLIFFTVAGAQFEPQVLVHHLDLIVVYSFARIAGKLLGAMAGAGLAGAPKPVVRWMGFALVPQAGVAVGLALTLTAEPAFAEAGALIVNIVLGATLLNELVGPFAVRFALMGADELGEDRSRRSR